MCVWVGNVLSTPRLLRSTDMKVCGLFVIVCFTFLASPQAIHFGALVEAGRVTLNEVRPTLSGIAVWNY